MQLFLMRHGEYLPETIDPQKPLSEKGIADCNRIAQHIKNKTQSLKKIFHSDMLRAQQTASIVQQIVCPTAVLEQKAGLAPNDDVTNWPAIISGATEDMMLVGHLPFMGLLTSLIITGETEHPVVSFDPGTLVCLEKADTQFWTIKYVLTPSL